MKTLLKIICLALFLASCTYMDRVHVLSCDGNHEQYDFHNALLYKYRYDSSVITFKYKNDKIKQIDINGKKDDVRERLYYSFNEIKPVFNLFGIHIEYPEAYFDHIILAHLMSIYNLNSKQELWKDSLSGDNSHIYMSKIDGDITFPNAETGHVGSVSFEVKDSCLIQWSYLWDHDYTGYNELITHKYQYDDKKRVKCIKSYTQAPNSIDSCTQYFYYKETSK